MPAPGTRRIHPSKKSSRRSDNFDSMDELDVMNRDVNVRTRDAEDDAYFEDENDDGSHQLFDISDQHGIYAFDHYYDGYSDKYHQYSKHDDDEYAMDDYEEKRWRDDYSNNLQDDAGNKYEKDIETSIMTLNNEIAKLPPENEKVENVDEYVRAVADAVVLDVGDVQDVETKQLPRIYNNRQFHRQCSLQWAWNYRACAFQ